MNPKIITREPKDLGVTSHFVQMGSQPGLEDRPVWDVFQACWGPMDTFCFFGFFPHNNYDRTKRFGFGWIRNSQSLKGAVVVTLCQNEAEVKISNGHWPSQLIYRTSRENQTDWTDSSMMYDEFNQSDFPCLFSEWDGGVNVYLTFYMCLILARGSRQLLLSIKDRSASNMPPVKEFPTRRESRVICSSLNIFLAWKGLIVGKYGFLPVASHISQSICMPTWYGQIHWDSMTSA